MSVKKLKRSLSREKIEKCDIISAYNMDSIIDDEDCKQLKRRRSFNSNPLDLLKDKIDKGNQILHHNRHASKEDCSPKRFVIPDKKPQIQASRVTTDGSRVLRKSWNLNLKDAGLPKLSVEGVTSPKHIGKTLKKWTGIEMKRTTSGNNIINLGASKKPITMSLLSTLLELMNVDSEEKNRIMFLVEIAISQEPESVSGMYNSREMKLLERLNSETQIILDYQDRHKNATKIQSLFRSYRVKKKIFSTDTKKLKLFNSEVYNVVKMEKQFTKQLGIITKNYLHPISTRLNSGKTILKANEIETIFSCVVPILGVHKENLKSLTLLLDNWPFLNGIGDVILQLRTGLSVYSTYVNNYNNAQELVHHLTSDKNNRFLTFLNEKQTSVTEFLTLLSSPLHHLSKLAENIGKIGLLCEQNSVEERKCNLAFSMLNETAQYIKDTLQNSEEHLTLMKVKRRLTNLEKFNFNITKDTKFVIEELFMYNGKKKDLVLFNKNLIIGKLSRGNQIKITENIELAVVFYEFDTKEPSKFILKTPSGVHNILGSPPNIELFIKKLAVTLPSRKRNPTFGRDFMEIIDRKKPDDNIPSIVKQTIQVIKEKNGLSVEGIFRISGEREQIYSLKDYFDTKTEEERDLSNFNIHAICGALKLWFRELPESLIPFKLYDKLIMLEKNEPDNILEEYSKLIKDIGAHYETLSYLIKFLRIVCDNVNENKMSPSNAAIVFGPGLMRAETETMETTLNSPLVNQAIQRLIEHANELFK